MNPLSKKYYANKKVSINEFLQITLQEKPLFFTTKLVFKSFPFICFKINAELSSTDFTYRHSFEKVPHVLGKLCLYPIFLLC